MPDVAVTNPVRQYEDLRRQVLGAGVGSSGGMGVALLMHRGMLAWMRAWSDCTQSSEAVAMKEPPDHVPVPGHLQPEVVAILAGMAWNHYQGVA